MPYKPSYKRKTVTRAFRNWTIERFNIRPHTPEWGFLCYLLLGAADESGGLPIPWQFLAKLEGIDPTSWNGRHIHITRPFLERMQSRFSELSIDWNEHAARRTRTLHYTLPSDVQQALAEELAVSPPVAERVYFLTGNQIDSRVKAAEREAQRTLVLEENGSELASANADQQLIFNYLNDLPSNRFTKVLEHMDEAKDLAMQLTEPTRGQQLTFLESIELQPQPFYGFAERSTRLVPQGCSLATIKSSLRRVLTQEWTEMDLKNAQLAINAKLWELPETQAFLQTGESWWDSLFEWFGIEANEEIKALFKDATYALCYGASQKTLQYGKDGKPGLGEYYNHFFKHTLVKEIWKGRQRRIKEIGTHGGCNDAYGNFLPISKSVSKRSVLAQVSQSYEQKLIAEIFHLANTTDKFRILLYQYDGVSVVIRDQRRKEYWLNQIKQAVKTKADSLGIATELTT